MKRFLVISDIHGDAAGVAVMEEALVRHGLKEILCLGDILYHGPRNDLPAGYAPKEVIPVMNRHSEEITAVRGNCDAEVDQMMVEFPITADYQVLDAGNKKFFLTHGHLWNEWKLPPIGIADVLVHGHTHVPELKTLECGMTIFNPGSVSLPKGGSSRSFGYYDGENLKHYVI